MDYLQQSAYQHFPHHPGNDIFGLHSFHTEQQSHIYNIQQQQSLNMAGGGGSKNETKPRLGKDEVEALEKEFNKNPKPSTQCKRGYAEKMSVDLSRINNWFQNRRAKRKQESKQEAYEARQQNEALGYSEPNSPSYFNPSFQVDNQMLQMPQAFNPGPPPASVGYNPNYADVTAASMQSLSRTFNAQNMNMNGNVSVSGPAFTFPCYTPSQDGLQTTQSLSLHGTSHLDSAQFPSSGPSSDQPQYQTHFDSSDLSPGHLQFPGSDLSTDQSQLPSSDLSSDQFTNYFNFARGFSEGQMFTEPMPVQAGLSLEAGHNSDPFTFQDNGRSLSLSAFPSQLISTPFNDTTLTMKPHDQDESQAPELKNETMPSPEFHHDQTAMSDTTKSSLSPPPPPMSFRSPPPPADIASRRKKMRPAKLEADTMRNRPSMGPRTLSQAEGFGRQGASPVNSSHMRRSASACMNQGGVLGSSSRVHKSGGIESAQRSPLQFGYSMNQLLDQVNPRAPALIASSSQSSSLASQSGSLAPPTPLSPNRTMSFGRKDSSSLAVSSGPANDPNSMFNGGVGMYPTLGAPLSEDQTPPETPHVALGLQSALSQSGWTNNNVDQQAWNFEAPDDPIWTPAQDTFPGIQMPSQPTYSSPSSQPTTPAFGAFTQSFQYGSNSPEYTNGTPMYQSQSNQSQNSEYSFPEQYNVGPSDNSPSMSTKQKQFQFSNTTAADFSEK